MNRALLPDPNDPMESLYRAGRDARPDDKYAPPQIS